MPNPIRLTLVIERGDPNLEEHADDLNRLAAIVARGDHDALIQFVDEDEVWFWGITELEKRWQNVRSC